jgi:tRNA pseudouridine13 synthase
VPNAFGPQRFGRDGRNPARALAWIEGRERGPRDKREQRLLFSALQSLWFNEVLAARELDGTWKTVLPGDVAKRHDSGGLFAVPLEGPELEDARARAEALAVSATGPMFGKKMRWPEGAPGALELDVLTRAIGDPHRLDAFAHLGEGTRRPLRLEVKDLEVKDLEVKDLEVKDLEVKELEGRDLAASPGDKGGAIQVSFVLPKGGYATTLLGRAFRLVDASARSGERDPAPGPGPQPEAEPEPEPEEEGAADAPSPLDPSPSR